MADVKVIESVRTLVDGMKSAIMTDNKEAIKKINDRFDVLEFEVKRAGRPAKESTGHETKDFLKAVRLFSKGGMAAVQAEMKDAKVTRSGKEGKSDNLVRFDVSAAGALLMPAEMSNDINKQIVEISPVMQVAKVVTTSAPSFKQARRDSSLTATWLDEDVAGSKTKDSFGFTDIPVHKLSARVAWTIEQEQDAAYDLEAEITNSIREQFDKTLGAAFISGNGVGKPTGLVGNVTDVTAGASTISADKLIELQYSVKSFYRANASWMMSRQTIREVRQLAIAAGGSTLSYLWEPNFKAGEPSLLLGSPVFEAQDLAQPSTAGAFATGDAMALYGDFNYGYVIPRHTDFYLLRDPYSEGSSFVTNIYAMSRFGGAVVRSEAIAQLTST
jgi:HK97 family phage major capsid protein